MTDKSNGMTYAPKGEAKAVVGPGSFPIAAVALDHGHIYAMCNGLTEAGADLRWVYDPDVSKAEAFRKQFPQAKIARSEREILEDEEIQLVAGAAIPCDRCALGLRVMDHGKDYFTDKAPFTTLAQLDQARARVSETGRKYAVYFGERLHSESTIYTGQLIRNGAVGRVIQLVILAPHRLSKENRPDWFFRKEQYGGILVDIGSHQFEQFLYLTGARDARVLHAQVANYNNPDYPELEDFGDATLIADNGATQYCRVDWFTPDGLGCWGDGRLFVLGTEGYIEVRKYIDIAHSPDGDHVYLVNGDGEQHFEVKGKVGFPFFGEFILDCVNRTETLMTQAHIFKAAEICLQAQEMADRARAHG